MRVASINLVSAIKGVGLIDPLNPQNPAHTFSHALLPPQIPHYVSAG